MDEIDLKPMEALAEDRQLKYVQFRTQLRNLILCYLHALTQSGYRLSFYENGAIKSIAPLHWDEGA